MSIVPEIDRLAIKVDPYITDEGGELKHLSAVRQTNVFVGPNNCGKSRFMRSLCQMTSYAMVKDAQIEDAFRTNLARARTEIHSIFDRYGLAIVGDVVRESLDIELAEHFEVSSKAINSLRDAVRKIAEWNHKHPAGQTHHFSADSRRQRAPTRVFFTDCASAVKPLADMFEANLEMSLVIPGPTARVYVPTLRGLRDIVAGDAFEAAIRRDYFNNEVGTQIVSGLGLYNALQRDLLGDLDARERVRSYEAMLTQSIFEGRQVALIPRVDHGTKVVHVKLGDAIERPIYELGEGLHTILLVTYPAFLSTNAWIFIEEPETHLHPDLQRRLLDVLLRDKNGNRFFITTHSNHLIDVALAHENMSLYRFRTLPEMSKDERGRQVEKQRFEISLRDPGDISILDLLGARTTSVFLANCTIWVEGVTDRKYLETMLRLHHEAEYPTRPFFTSGVHYTFVEYGGSNIDHFTFGGKEISGPGSSPDDLRIDVLRLCGQAMIVADCDGGKKRNRDGRLEQELGDRFVLLPCREVENLLPPVVLNRIVGMYECDDKVSIFSDDWQDYRDEYLGGYIDRKLPEANRKRRRNYADDKSKTLHEKTTICAKALPLLDSAAYAAMHEDARNVVARIYQFIKSANTRNAQPG